MIFAVFLSVAVNTMDKLQFLVLYKLNTDTQMHERHKKKLHDEPGHGPTAALF